MNAYWWLTLRTHIEDAQSTHIVNLQLGRILRMHNKYAYCEFTIRTHIEDSQLGRILRIHNLDAYTECTIRTKLRNHSKDAYWGFTIRRLLGMHNMDVYWGLPLRTHIEDFQLGHTLRIDNKDAYEWCTIRTHKYSIYYLTH